MEKTFLSKQGVNSFRGKQGKYKRKREIKEKQNFCHLPWTSGSVNTWQREKYSINYFKGGPLPLRCDLSRVLIFTCSMSHIRPYLFSSPEAEDDVRDIGKNDFPSVLLQPMLSNANLAGRASQQPRCRMITVAYLFVIMPNATIVVKIYLTLIFRGISQKESAHHL